VPDKDKAAQVLAVDHNGDPARGEHRDHQAGPQQARPGTTYGV
jgi:hypothetical protein